MTAGLASATMHLRVARLKEGPNPDAYDPREDSSGSRRRLSPKTRPRIKVPDDNPPEEKDADAIAELQGNAGSQPR